MSLNQTPFKTVSSLRARGETFLSLTKIPIKMETLATLLGISSRGIQISAPLAWISKVMFKTRRLFRNQQTLMLGMARISATTIMLMLTQLLMCSSNWTVESASSSTNHHPLLMLRDNMTRILPQCLIWETQENLHKPTTIRRWSMISPQN